MNTKKQLFFDFWKSITGREDSDGLMQEAQEMAQKALITQKDWKNFYKQQNLETIVF